MDKTYYLCFALVGGVVSPVKYTMAEDILLFSTLQPIHSDNATLHEPLSKRVFSENQATSVTQESLSAYAHRGPREATLSSLWGEASSAAPSAVSKVKEQHPRKKSQSKVKSRSAHDWFRDMVGVALNHSPEVKSLMSDQEASSWTVKQVKGQYYPQVNITGGVPFGASGNQNGHSIDDSNIAVTVTTRVFDWGKLSAELAVAKEDVNSSEYSVKEMREKIASDTLTELLNLIRYHESIKLAQEYVERMNELVTMLSGITHADKGRVSELVQARARLLSAQSEKEKLVHLYDSSRIKLVRLLGVEPSLPPKVRWDKGFIPLTTALNAVSDHPTLKRSDSEVRAAKASVESAKLSGYPQVNWVVQKNISNGSNYDSNDWYTGLNVEWSLFSGGSQQSAYQVAKAKYQSAKDKNQLSRFELEYQIKSMAEMRDSALIRARSFDALSRESDNVRNMFYRQWYHLGSRTLLDVLTAESEYFNHNVSAVNNRYDAFISNVSLMYNAGVLLNWLIDPVNRSKPER
jgi:adhesin transport system outer membrane protein